MSPAMRRAIFVHLRGRWPQEAAIGTVTLGYLDRHRRRIRLLADAGETFLLDLPHAQLLAEGDGLELDGGGYLRVCAAPEPVLEIEAADMAARLRIAWHLGNRHLPVQIVGERLRIRDDHVIDDMVVGLGGKVTRLDAPFDPEPGAYAGVGHDHAHSGDG